MLNKPSKDKYLAYEKQAFDFYNAFPPLVAYNTTTVTVDDPFKNEDKTMSFDNKTPIEVQQKNHLTFRLSTIYYDHSRKLEKAFKLYPDYPKSVQDMVERIQKGQFQLRDKDSRRDCYDEVMLDNIIWRAPGEEPDLKGYEAAYAKLNKVYTDAKDMIVVYDASEGLKAVQEFESATFH